MIGKYLFTLITIFLIIYILLDRFVHKYLHESYSSEHDNVSYDNVSYDNVSYDNVSYYPKVVTWSPSFVDNYYQPGYNQYFYNNGYYYPVY